MTFSYFRKSRFGVEETVANVKKNAEKLGLKVLGETKLSKTKGVVLHICGADWLDRLVESDANLIGLMPCSVLVFERDGKVSVGAGRPSILGSVAQTDALMHLSEEAESQLKNLVNDSAGVGALVPAKIKIYSTTTCPYCKMEKAWLTEKKVPFEDVLVDVDRAAGEEMVRKTGQMGVPVTEIQYEDAEPDYIVGFDKPQLSQILNIK